MDLSNVHFSPYAKYYSDVILCNNTEDKNTIFKFIEDWQKTKPSHKFLLLATHEDHIHLCHDCTAPNGQCRCKFRRLNVVADGLRRGIRNRKPITRLSAKDWHNIFQYFIFQRPQESAQVWINGEKQEICRSSKDIQWGDDVGRTERLLEINPTCTSCDPSGDGSEVFAISEALVRNTEEPDTEGRSDRAKKTKYEQVWSEVSAVLNQYNPVPPNSITRILKTDSDFDKFQTVLYDPGFTKYFDSSIEQYSDMLLNYTLRDFYEMYVRGRPIFLADSKNPFHFYLDRGKSMHSLMQILSHQCGTRECIVSFLRDIVSWFDKKGIIPVGDTECSIKMNTIAIYGDVSAGKNFFMDTIVAIAQNVGYIGIVNKTNKFGFQECVNKRLICGNEVNIERCQMDTMKSLCEGSPVNIDVKFKKGCITRRTPLLLMNNSPLAFYEDPAFKNVRIKAFCWTYSPFLKNYDKKPYPLAFFDVLEHYEIKF